MKSDSTTIIDELRGRGLRATAARCAVLEWLEHEPHATADQVHRGVIDRLGSVSRQAVYDVLAACVDAELIRQIRPAGHPARFERRIGDNHHHLVCRGCGFIADADCHTAEAPCMTPDHDLDFVIDESEIVFWGACRECRGPDRHSGRQEAN